MSATQSGTILTLLLSEGIFRINLRNSIKSLQFTAKSAIFPQKTAF